MSVAFSEDEKYVGVMSHHQYTLAEKFYQTHKDVSSNDFIEALAVLLATETARGIRLQSRVIEGEDVATAIVAEFGSAEIPNA